MSDIVERLQERQASGVNCLCGNPVCDEAAEEILRLRAEVEKLRAENNEAYVFGLHKGKEAAFIDYGIERLRAENEKLRALLQEARDWVDQGESGWQTFVGQIDAAIGETEDD